MVEDVPVVSEKKQVKSSSVNDIGPRSFLKPRSRNDIDLKYSHIFIKSISFRSQTAVVSETFTFFIFSYRKANIAKF